MQIAAPFTESEIKAGALGGALVTVPNMAERPAALILPGSGPTDLDGNNPLGVRAATYRYLAHELAQRGISSLRIDKRGLFSSAGATADPNAVTIGDYVQDTETWLDRIRKATGAAKVWLIGHSEGGLVALATALTSRHVAGIILLAAPGRKLGAILRAQLSANPANGALLSEAMTAIEALERGDRIKDATLHPTLKPLFREEVQSFLIDALSYDPALLMRQVTLPVLVVQGEKDLQVSAEDAHLLAAARPGVELVLLPDVNHVLKTIQGDGTAANFAAYGDADQPLSREVADAIADYINRQVQS